MGRSGRLILVEQVAPMKATHLMSCEGLMPKNAVHFDDGAPYRGCGRVRACRRRWVQGPAQATATLVAFSRFAA